MGMMSKISSKHLLYIISSINIAVSLVVIFVLTPGLVGWGSEIKMKPISITDSQVLQNQNNVKLVEQIVPGVPMRLKIPTINVDSAVEFVGLTSQGALDTPKNQNDVAWYYKGQRPGESGNAVIDGHYGWKDGKESAFDNLYKLIKGDKILVEDDKGVVVSFVVRDTRRYDVDANASEVFDSSDDNAHLNLITCEGDWDKNSKSYSKRLVVFADKENQ